MESGIGLDETVFQRADEFDRATGFFTGTEGGSTGEDAMRIHPWEGVGVEAKGGSGGDGGD